MKSSQVYFWEILIGLVFVCLTLLTSVGILLSVQSTKIAVETIQKETVILIPDELPTDIAVKPVLDDFENSAELPPASLETVEATIDMMLFGDVMLGRYVREKMNVEGVSYPFQQVSPLFQNKDLVILNLEGPFTTFPPQSLNPNNVTFTFKPDILPMLKEQGVTTVSLANNHTRDYGVDGFNQTKSFLEEEGIDYFGDYFNKDSVSLVKEIHGIKIGFIGYHQFSYQNVDLLLAETERLRSKVDWLVVFPHWGEEYQTYSFTPFQQERAYAFIDAGADLVIGAHPHVIQPLEEYKDGLIFYSMGNFIFDQQFSTDVKQGLGLHLLFTKEGYKIDLIPLQHVDMQATIMEPVQAQVVWGRLAETSLISQELAEMLRQGRVVK